LTRLDDSKSPTSDGRGRGTGRFLDLYSLLKLAFKDFDEPMTNERSLSQSVVCVLLTVQGLELSEPLLDFGSIIASDFSG